MSFEDTNAKFQAMWVTTSQAVTAAKKASDVLCHAKQVNDAAQSWSSTEAKEAAAKVEREAKQQYEDANAAVSAAREAVEVEREAIWPTLSEEEREILMHRYYFPWLGELILQEHPRP